MKLVDYCRQQGVAMGSVHAGRHIGWTTDIEKANVCRDAGANIVEGYNSVGPNGWELSFAVGRNAVLLSPRGASVSSVVS